MKDVHRDFGWISSERSDVLLNPAESLTLVLKPKVSNPCRPYFLASQESEGYNR
jgi:hypothetical protein